ncbi:MAG: transposase [Propionicimonas sp.]
MGRSMPRRARQLSESGIYHVMLRGINRQAIFLDEEDHLRFLHCLHDTRELSGCRVLAYCLMPNHVHLVLRAEGESIGQVVKRLGVRYAWWHNVKYDRVGHVFQDRFRSCPVDDDEYFVTLLRYVWNNPVKAGMVERPDQYRWSSLGRDALVDQDVLQSFIEQTTLAQLASTPDPDADNPEPLPPHHPALTDTAVATMLDLFCQQHHVPSFGLLPIVARERVLLQSLSCGASVRQLSRLTSVSRMSIQRLAQRPNAS